MSSPFRENVRVSTWEEPFLTQKSEPFFFPACIPFSWEEGSYPPKPSLAPGWPSQKVTLLSNTCKIFGVNRRLCRHRWYESMKWLFGFALQSLGGPAVPTPLYVTHCLHFVIFPNVPTLSFLMPPHLWPPSLLVITSLGHFSLCTSQEKLSAFQRNLNQRREVLHTHACRPRPQMNYFIVLSFWKECQDV